MKFVRNSRFLFSLLIIFFFPFDSLCDKKIEFNFHTETKFEVEYGTSDIDINGEQIFLANFMLNHILVVNRKGETIKVIGGKGQGPGEFGSGSPKSILIVGGRIIAPDIGGLRLQIIDINGNLLKQYRFMKEIPVFPVLNLYPLTNNEIGIYGYIFNKLSPEGMSAIHKFIIFDIDKGFSREVYSTPSVTVNIKEMNPFAGYISPSIKESLIFQADKETYNIEIFSTNGKKIGKIQKDVKPVPISDTVKKYIEENYELSSIKAVGINFIFPKNLPVIRSILATNEYLLVWTWASWYKNNFGKREEDRYEVDIFDLSGNYIGQGITNFNIEEVVKIKGERVCLLSRKGEEKEARIGRITIISNSHKI